MNDPLRLNLGRQTRVLLENISITSNFAADIRNASSTSQLLAILSTLLAAPSLTLTIAALYRPILFDLCSRWLQHKQNTEDQLVALALLLEVHEELFPYVSSASHVSLN